MKQHGPSCSIPGRGNIRPADSCDSDEKPLRPPGPEPSSHDLRTPLRGLCDVYDERYAPTYGMFRLNRIRDIGDRFLICGDYRLGVVRVRCTNPACGHDYFKPFSCKGFFLCPSCSQKRTLLFAEHLTNEVLLDLPHRQFVFTIPKALRPFFRHDRRLSAEVSRLIYAIAALGLNFLSTG